MEHLPEEQTEPMESVLNLAATSLPSVQQTEEIQYLETLQQKEEATEQALITGTPQTTATEEQEHQEEDVLDTLTEENAT
jgi:hypothetical protein